MINNRPISYCYTFCQPHQVTGPAAVHYLYQSGFYVQPPNYIYQTFQPAQAATQSIVNPLNMSKMSVQEAANWIYNLGVRLMWDEADCQAYRISFKANRIDGIEIMNLNHDKLQNILKIKKLGHRLSIIKVVMVLRRQKVIERVNVLARFHEQCELDSLFHPSLFTDPSSSEAETMSAPAPKNRFTNEKRKINQGNGNRILEVFSDGTHRRYPAGSNYRSRKIANCRSHLKRGGRAERSQSEQSFACCGRAQTTVSTDETSMVSETRDEKPVANSRRCSRGSSDKLRPDAVNGNDTKRSLKSWDIPPLKAKRKSWISLRRVQDGHCEEKTTGTAALSSTSYGVHSD